MSGFEVTGVVLAIPGVVQITKRAIDAIMGVRCAPSPRTEAIHNDLDRPRAFPKVLNNSWRVFVGKGRN